MGTENPRALVAEVVRRFNTLDMAQILACFSTDVLTNYNGLEIRGRDALADFLAPRYADLREYRLEKTLRMQDGDSLGIEATARFRRQSTGERVTMLIHEFLVIRQGLICRWDYVGHAL